MRRDLKIESEKHWSGEHDFPVTTGFGILVCES